MPNIQESITSERTLAMLRTAMGADIAGALDDPKIIEIMLNPDGHIWVDQIGKGRFDTEKFLTPREAERVVRLVGSPYQSRCNNQSAYNQRGASSL